MDIDLLIENGVIVVPKAGSFKGSLGITGGKIVGIYDTDHRISAKERIDAGGNYILPGCWNPTPITATNGILIKISKPRAPLRPSVG